MACHYAIAKLKLPETGITLVEKGLWHMNCDERGMYDFAYTLVKSAGVQLKQARSQFRIHVREKTSQMDLVTDQDVLIEKFLVEEILKRYPEHNFLAEESYVSGDQDNVNYNREAYTWIIDPIDGTINYYRWGKDYAISLALYRNQSPIFGLVYDVANDIMYGGRQHEGALRNGIRLDTLTEGHKSLNKAIVAMSLRTMREFEGIGMDVLEMLSKVQAHRYMGCASLELCKVANGEYDLFISSNVYEWDVAAARIFLEQRGGVFLYLKKDNYRFAGSKMFVAAFRSALIWKETLEHLPECIKLGFDAQMTY